jgi:mannose-6-phosphate isomerase
MAFSVAPFQKRVPKPWGFEIIFTPDGLDRAGKFLFIKAGKRLSFQYHDAKEETLCLASGKALLWLENAAGEIEKIPMEPRKGYTVALMQKHRVEAVEDCVIVEASQPERGNTVRLDDDYRRDTETEEMRAETDRGWTKTR